MATQYVDFFLIDNSAPDDRVLSIERFITFGEGTVESVVDLVSVVSSKCKANNAKVGTLRLSGHGDEDGGPIGKDWITVATLPKYSVDLAKLNAYFDRSRTTVIFDSCLTGTNIRLLSKLSELWNGVPVSGFFENQVPNFIKPSDEGLKFTCTLKNCVGTHPDTTARSTIRLR